ncbi:MAG: pantetheine-phosphate adenylyltransferase [Cytophagales bacterium]|nr:pantetheine-phosphate adenylyltransferase [Cytophagales bacterium]
MKRIALFPGSFDPFTKGHQDIVLRGLTLFDEVVIAIGHNSTKSRYFPLDYMKLKIQSTFSHEPRITVEVFEGLTSSFAKKMGANFLLRGLRNTTDFEYENTICQANKFLNNDLETVLLITSPNLAYISSSIVRDIHKYNGNVDEFLPYKL